MNPKTVICCKANCSEWYSCSRLENDETQCYAKHYFHWGFTWNDFAPLANWNQNPWHKASDHLQKKVFW